jgi:hypothetical protein
MEVVGGTRMIDVGLGDDHASDELYRGELTKWLDKVAPGTLWKRRWRNVTVGSPRTIIYSVESSG